MLITIAVWYEGSYYITFVLRNTSCKMFINFLCSKGLTETPLYYPRSTPSCSSILINPLIIAECRIENLLILIIIITVNFVYPFVFFFIPGRKYPFYGSQWHPEKNAFEWNESLHMPHTADAIEAAQTMANFFVDEARKSSHRVAATGEDRYLIYEHTPVFTPGGHFEQVYVF